ncbi:MAG: hypothetical protein QW056_02275 [Candidatus Bathyarchaeia archaeon]
MPIIVDVEKSGEKELDGAFRISAKGVNLWVRIYNTGYGGRARITVSYFEDGVWKTTPAIWIDKNLCNQLIEKLLMLEEKLT